MITEDYVRSIFKGLEQGDGAGFFEHVDDKVDWIVEGTHPLAGHYKSKADFLAGTFAKLNKVLPGGAQLIVEHLLVKDDQAVVELHSLATAKNGLRSEHRYGWPAPFTGHPLARERAFFVWERVARLFEKTPIYFGGKRKKIPILVGGKAASHMPTSILPGRGSFVMTLPRRQFLRLAAG